MNPLALQACCLRALVSAPADNPGTGAGAKSDRESAMQMNEMRRRKFLARSAAAIAALSFGVVGLRLHEPSARAAEPPKPTDTFGESEILEDVKKFFGDTTEGLAALVAKLFREQGSPNGFIRGEEVSGAIGVGLRYGNGVLTLKDKDTRKVYWQGPSVGFDVGGNASKVYVLVYNMLAPDSIYQRFPSIDGSAYFVGGIGVNYQRRDGITLAPIRLGVGLRSGASLGYMHYTREKTLNPL